MSAPDSLTVNEQRLWTSLDTLAEIGAYDDVDSGLRGVRRLALTDEDVAGRELVMGWMRDAGLQVALDEVGNIHARRPGRDDSLSPVMIGSHIDSVATAGRFDGCLGVLGGLEVIRTLEEAGHVTLRPLELVVFTEEEGVRFGMDMLGSAVAAGRADLASARALTDRDGIAVGAELDRHGLVGDLPVPFDPPHAFLECHIEQGPILEAAGVEIGVVDGVQAISWQAIEIHGRAAHAGTTPQELRRNAGLAAALLTVHVDDMVRSGRFGRLLGTVGRLDLRPDLVNTVPAYAFMTVDLRHPEEDLLRAAEDEVQAHLGIIEERTGVSTTSRRTARTTPVAFDRTVMDLIERQATGAGLTTKALTSGAGHDAGEMAALCPAGMVFVPGLYEGISHNPREYSTPRACALGITVLLRSVLELAEEPGRPGAISGGMHEAARPVRSGER